MTTTTHPQAHLGEVLRRPENQSMVKVIPYS